MDRLERLEGFKEPWEFAVCKGRAVKLDASLHDNQIMTDAVITVVRRVLVPEAWKVGMHQLTAAPFRSTSVGADDRLCSNFFTK